MVQSLFVARWNTDLDAEATPLEPYYEMRHRHLHRNARYDVTGYSPLDGQNQSSHAQQFEPYGALFAEAAVSMHPD